MSDTTESPRPMTSTSTAGPAAEKAPVVDAIVLAGGRSSRLDGTAKSGLVVDGRTLLDLAVDACSGARAVAVVGDAADLPLEARLSDRVLITREEPEFGGPAAGIAAGAALLTVLGSEPSALTLVVACDLVHASDAVERVLDAARAAGSTDGVIAVDSTGRRQWLLAAYSTEKLAAAVEAHGPDLTGASVHGMLGDLELTEVALTDGVADDVDTWDDAERLGVTAPDARK
ncbi:molybdenum cofactor guanylyltransferase [Marisediminicola sp. LYQ134]|uniref:molybdenum cofactor guanylyltransferase n=1 Tax=Marisediminicola sp. LYQ134 TaxID=3391061 RepID=UPI003983CDCA